MKQLIGKYYPVRNEDSQIIGFKTITKVYEAENMAGYALFLDNSDTYIQIGIAEASRILDRDLYQCLDKRIE